MLFAWFCTAGMKNYEDLGRNVLHLAKAFLSPIVHENLNAPLLKRATPSKATLFRCGPYRNRINRVTVSRAGAGPFPFQGLRLQIDARDGRRARLSFRIFAASEEPS